jgi:membrane-associated phospholipid phosphatase
MVSTKGPDCLVYFGVRFSIVNILYTFFLTKTSFVKLSRRWAVSLEITWNSRYEIDYIPMELYHSNPSAMNNFMTRANALFMIILLSLTVTVKAQAMDGYETAGDFFSVALPVAAAGYALSIDDHSGLLQFAASEALTFGATYGLKYIINEKRPNGGDHSFPSGHTAVSFASAEFVRERYGWNYGIPAYLIATFVGISRIESDNHYTHDVLAGAAIGICSSMLFTTPYKGWNVKPHVASNYYGLSLNGTW